MLPSRVTGPWTLADLRDGKIGSPKNGLTVFSCFHCGGGSSMGYKLAGFDVVGGVEIDPKMMALYRKNLNPDPDFSFQMPIQDFRVGYNVPPHDELLELDVLDGSPPCSSFSMSGSRDKDWSKEKVFKEGQAKQVLDDLFFHFIAVAKRLRPRVVVAENVKGLIMGKARGYVAEIFEAFDDAGYECQLFLLNASRMGVPQVRERTFFVARRKDLSLPKVDLSFSEEPIGIGQACEGSLGNGKGLTKMALRLWERTPQGMGLNAVHPKKSWFAHRRPHPTHPIGTVIGGTPSYHWSEPRYLSDAEIIRAQTFPDDYDFAGLPAQYVCGMSVPPLMMQRLALEIAEQALLNTNHVVA